MDDKSAELQSGINRLSEQFGATPISVGLRTNDGLNLYIADDGTYHYAFYERGHLSVDRTGTLDDLLYWYCEGLAFHSASKLAPADRIHLFQSEYEILSRISADWAKRQVRELAEKFRKYGQSQDIALLPDIGEPL
nr:immunity 63 family protein [Mycobacteroides abscessus]